MRNRRWPVISAALVLVVAAVPVMAAPQLAIDPAGYRLVAKTRINRVTFSYTYRATVVNTGTDAWGVAGTVATAAPGLSITDDSVSFGPVPAGGRVLSTDTFTVRQNPTGKVTASAFDWSLSSGAPFTLQLGADQANASQASTLNLRVTVSRAAGFTGDVDVALQDPPEGVSVLTATLPGSISAGTLSIRIGPDVPLGSTGLTVMASTSGEVIESDPFALTVGEPQPGSQALIAAALEAGTIDFGTSLLYRAYASFGDVRLPAEFVGSGPEGEDLRLFDEIESALGTLSPALEAELIPFTLRPADPGSWFNRDSSAIAASAPAARTGITTLAAAAAVELPMDCIDLPATGGWISRRSDQWPIRIWTKCPDNASATSAAAYTVISAWLEIADRVWLPMTAASFMGEPLPDNVAGAANIRADIGDEAIDIYVTPNFGPNRGGLPPSSLGADVDGKSIRAAPPNTTDQSRRSGYILVPVDATLSTGGAQAILVHELMHVLQWAHNAVIAPNGPGGSTFWWYADASAEWAAAHFDRDAVTRPPVRAAWGKVYRQFDEEFQASDLPLNDPGDHRYGAFIWLYLMEQIHGPVNVRSLVGGSWRALAGKTTWDEGDLVLDNTFNFDAAFPLFAKRNLNQPFDPALPQTERYVSQDSAEFIDDVAPKHTEDDLDVQPYELRYQTTIPPMSARYRKFTFDDASTKKVVFNLDDTEFGVMPMYAQVVYRTDSGWHHDIWNNEILVSFCYDKPGEQLKELWLVLSNHLLKPKGGADVAAKFGVTVSDAPCRPGWVGNTTWEFQSPDQYKIVQATVRWVYNEVYSVDVQHPNFDPVGTVSIIKWGSPRCGDAKLEPNNAPITFDDADDLTDGLLVIDYTQPEPITAAESGVTGFVTRATFTCPGEEPLVIDPYGIYADWWSLFSGDYTKLTNNGTTIEGSRTDNIGGATVIQTYKFTRVDN